MSATFLVHMMAAAKNTITAQPNVFLTNKAQHSNNSRRGRHVETRTHASNTSRRALYIRHNIIPRKLPSTGPYHMIGFRGAYPAN